MIDVYVDIDDSFTAAAAWLDSETYVEGDRVYDDLGQSTVTLSPIYVCINANSNSAPSSSNANWILAGTSPKYPLLTKDPMDVIYSGQANPFDYEWSFDGTNLRADETNHPTVMRHYRMIEEAGGGRVIFMFETYDSPWTGSGSNKAMLRLVPGPILSETTKLTFDSYGKNTTIIVNGYNGSGNSCGLNLGLLASDSASSLLANNYYFNNLTFNQTHHFSGLMAMAGGEFTGCKFIKTEYSGGSAGGDGQRFFISTYGSTVKAKFKSCLFEQSYGVGVKGNSTGTEFISCTFSYTNYDSVNSYAYANQGLDNLNTSNLKTFKNNIFYIKKIQNFDPNQSYANHHKVMDNGTIYYSQGVYTPGASKPPSDSTSAWATFNTNWTPKAPDRSNNTLYIEGYESSSNYVDVTYQNPMLVDPDSSDYRLRPSSPLIGVNSSSILGRDEIYVTPSERTGEFPSAVGSVVVKFNNVSTGYSCLAGIRMPNNGEIYECINTHTLDTSQDFATDTTNWRLVLGTIDDPYGSNEFENDDTIINKLTSNHDLILLDGDYNYFPITSDSSYPTTSPVLRPLNKDKAIINHSMRPAGFICKDIVFSNSSLQIRGFQEYPLNGRIGFQLYNCTLHSNQEWWPPLNCVVKNCLIFHELDNYGLFYGAFGQATSPLPTDKAITFSGNTVILSGTLTNDGVLSSLINQGNINATFEKNIFYVKSGFNANSNNKWMVNLSLDKPEVIRRENIIFDENGVFVENPSDMINIDPKLVDPSSTDPASFRLRPDSPLIGGVSLKYPADAIWVQSGSGSGSGTEDDPYYWTTEYSAAFLAAAQSSSKQLIFKDGTYIWISNILQDDNVGNNITMVAENTHQAIFTDNSRISSASKNPTLRFKGIQLVANDHFTWQGECHYIFDSVHLIGKKYMGALSVTASGCIFEVATGVNSYIFSISGPVDISNCIFVDHNDRTSAQNYLTGAQSGTIKNTIFYTKNPRDNCINADHNAVLVNCASENITSPEDGVIFNENLGLLDVENKNYNLRPLSPLIGQGG